MSSLEDTNQILNGAEVLAAGKTMGLSYDESIKLKAETLRQQQRKDVLKRLNVKVIKAAEAFLAENDAQFRAKGQPTDFEKRLALGGAFAENIDDEAFAFGEDPIIQLDSKASGSKKRIAHKMTIRCLHGRKVRNDVLGPDFCGTRLTAK